MRDVLSIGTRKGSRAEPARKAGLAVLAFLAWDLPFFPAAQAAEASIEALKAQALALHREAAVAEPAADEFIAYVGTGTAELHLRSISVRIDDAPPWRYEYSADEAEALPSRALHRLGTVPLTPGPHRLRADFVARKADAAPADAPLRGAIDRSFDKREAPLILQLELVKQGFGKPELRVIERAVSDAADLRARSADFLKAGGRDLQAALESGNVSLPPSGGSAPPGGGAYAAQYAHGLALLAGERAAEGAALLGRIADGDSGTAVSRALRDKAHLALGYHLLRDGRCKEASEAFRQVSAVGPSTNAALLGLGWALLFDGAKPAAATPTDGEESALRRLTPFRHAADVPGGDGEERLRAALVPWTELIGRDPTDPAVQEGMLAIPYAMTHMGAQQQALRYYGRALELLERTQGHLDAAAAHVQSGRMAQFLASRNSATGSGWPWWLAALPEPRWWLSNPPKVPENFYLERLLADDEFHATLSGYRELMSLDTLLSGYEQQQDTGARARALRSEGAAAAEAQRRRLEAIALARLADVKKQTERYLGEAHFALARMYDQPSADDADGRADVLLPRGGRGEGQARSDWRGEGGRDAEVASAQGALR